MIKCLLIIYVLCLMAPCYLSQYQVKYFKSCELMPKLKKYTVESIIRSCTITAKDPTDENMLNTIRNLPIKLIIDGQNVANTYQYDIIIPRAKSRNSTYTYFCNDREAIYGPCPLDVLTPEEKPIIDIKINPRKKEYGMEDILASCDIYKIYTEQNNRTELDESNLKLRLQVKNEQERTIFESTSYEYDVPMPAELMNEDKVELFVYCKGTDIYGPLLVKREALEDITITFRTNSVLLPGHIVKCITKDNMFGEGVVWEHIAGERVKTVDSDLYIGLSKITPDMLEPASITYRCVYNNSYKVVTYKIASILSFSLSPLSKQYEVDDSINCEFTAYETFSSEKLFYIKNSITVRIELNHADGRIEYTPWASNYAIIPETKGQIFSYKIICRLMHLSMEPIPINVRYSLMTHLSPNKEYYFQGEMVTCDYERYDTDDASLAFALIQIPLDLLTTVESYSASDAIRELPIKWYNLSYKIPSYIFKPNSNLLIAVCRLGSEETKPRFISIQSGPHLTLKQIFPPETDDIMKQKYFIPGTRFECRYKDPSIRVKWSCYRCRLENIQREEGNYLILREMEMETQLLYRCVAHVDSIKQNQPSISINIIIVVRPVITLGMDGSFIRPGDLVTCAARGTSVITNENYKIFLNAELILKDAEKGFTLGGYGQEAFAQSASITHYAECEITEKLRSGKKFVNVRQWYLPKHETNKNFTYYKITYTPDLIKPVAPETKISCQGTFYNSSETAQGLVTLYYRNDYVNGGQWITYKRDPVITLPNFFDHGNEQVRIWIATIEVTCLFYKYEEKRTSITLPPCNNGSVTQLEVIPINDLVVMPGDQMACQGEGSCYGIQYDIYMSNILLQYSDVPVFYERIRNNVMKIQHKHYGYRMIVCNFVKDDDYNNTGPFVIDTTFHKFIMVEVPPFDIKIRGFTPSMQAFDELSCGGEGFPRPTIYWVQIAGPSELYIKASYRILIRQWDNPGRYSYLCQLSNKHGTYEKFITFSIKNNFRWRMSNDFKCFFIILSMMILSILLMMLGWKVIFHTAKVKSSLGI